LVVGPDNPEEEVILLVEVGARREIPAGSISGPDLAILVGICALDAELLANHVGPLWDVVRNLQLLAAHCGCGGGRRATEGEEGPPRRKQDEQEGRRTIRWIIDNVLA
jgi:hypothetical protein